MSQHHTDIESDTQREKDSCTLERFSRNQFFHGKLMTARDMQAEQAYHAGRLETLARLVVGEGVIAGLEPSITDDNGSVTVGVARGVALDACGRLVVVDGDDDVPVPENDVPEGGNVSVFLEFEPCDAEKVPVPGSQDACSENCEYNRVVEDYSVRLVEGRPAQRKPIPSVEFPTEAELNETNSHDEDGEPHQDLSKAALTYHEHVDEDEIETGDAAVFLGYFEKADGEWERHPESEPPHYVYTNDMLYAALVGHAADFENPHEVHLDVEDLGGDEATLLRNERHVDTGSDPPHPGDVAFTSPEATVAIAGSSGNGFDEIALELGDEPRAVLEDAKSHHTNTDNPHDVLAALAGDGERVEPEDGTIDVVSREGVAVEAAPDDHELGIGLETDALEGLIRELIEELVGGFEEGDWELIRSAIQTVNGVGSDEEGGIELSPETGIAIDEDPANSSITIELDEETLQRLDQLESRLDALEGDGFDVGDIDWDSRIRDQLTTVDLSDYLTDYDRIRTEIDRLDAIRTDLDGIDTRVSDLDTQYQDIDGQISTLDSEIQTVDSRVSSLDSEFQNIDSQVATLESDIQNFDSRIETVNADLANTASNLSALSNNLQSEHGMTVPQFNTGNLNVDLTNYDVVINDSFRDDFPTG